MFALLPWLNNCTVSGILSRISTITSEEIKQIKSESMIVFYWGSMVGWGIEHTLWLAAWLSWLHLVDNLNESIEKYFIKVIKWLLVSTFSPSLLSFLPSSLPLFFHLILFLYFFVSFNHFNVCSWHIYVHENTLRDVNRTLEKQVTHSAFCLVFLLLSCSTSPIMFILQ